MNKVVSVIIPTYNTSHELLARAVASAASQEHVLEIIVVDDGSSESYLSSMSSVKDEHPSIVTIKHIKKAGVSAARNCGLECAKGDFIIFLDSDDELANGFISSAVKKINQYDADAVFGVGVRVYSETTAQSIAFGNIDLMSNEVVLEGAGIEVLKSSLFNGSAMTRVSLEPAKYVSNCGAIYRNSTIKSIRFREGITISEDRIFNFDFFDKASRIVLVGEIYYYYNCNEVSTSQSMRKNALKEMESTALEIEKYANEASPMLKDDINYGIIECFLQTMWFTIGHREFHKEAGVSRRSFVKSVCEVPVYNRVFKDARLKSYKLRLLRHLFLNRKYTLMTACLVMNSLLSKIKRKGVNIGKNRDSDTMG